MTKRHVKIVLGITLFLASDFCLAQQEQCANNMRLHVYYMPSAIIGESARNRDGVFFKLRQEYLNIRSGFRELSGEQFAYLDDLELKNIAASPPATLRAYRSYFENAQNSNVLQSVTAYVEQYEDSASFILETFVGACEPQMNCLFNDDFDIPPRENRDLMVDYYFALTLYALSVDARFKCPDIVARQLRKAAAEHILEVRRRGKFFDRLCELITILGASTEELENCG